LKEFAQLAAERNRRKKKRSVTIRIAPDVLETYRTMGDGYTGVMADVLKYAINNPAVLANATCHKVTPRDITPRDIMPRGLLTKRAVYCIYFTRVVFFLRHASF
jgi:hypothetical protein